MFGLQRAGMTLLKDNRFSAMFRNPDFQIDTESEEYKLLNPVIAKLDKAKMKKQKEEMDKLEEMDDDVRKAKTFFVKGITKGFCHQWRSFFQHLI